MTLLLPGGLFVNRHQPLDGIIELDGEVHANHGDAIGGAVAFMAHRDGDGGHQGPLGEAAVGAQPSAKAPRARRQDDVVDAGVECALDGFHIIEGNIDQGDRAIRGERSIEGGRR